MVTIDEPGQQEWKDRTRPGGREATWSSLLVALSLCALLGGCHPDHSNDVTYHEHVAPLLERHCARCHSGAENIAPLSFDTFEDAAPLASLIASSTRSRRMPPFPADNSGSCATYHDPYEAWLADEDIEVFNQWAEADAPEGDPSRAPSVSEPGPAAMERVDVTISTGAEYLPTPPEGGEDDYRCFVTEIVAPDDQYIVAYHAQPSDLATAHHFVLYVPQSDAAAEAALALDASEPEAPGYSCFGSAGVNAVVGVAWGPGTGASLLPEGTGVPVPGGRPLIIQMHYNTASGSAPTSTSVELQLEDKVEAPLTMLAVGAGSPGDFSIPPGDEQFEVLVSETVAEAANFDVGAGVMAYSLLPHMHLFGRELHLSHTAVSSEEENCLMSMPDWDFEWQFMYDFTTPVFLGAEDQLELRCIYDSSSSDVAVSSGEGSDDEMCFGMFLVSPAQP